MRESSATTPGSGFTVGICATGSPAHLGNLVEETLNEVDRKALNLRKVFIVASGCTAPVIDELRRISGRDARVQVVVEDRRHGKADAINKIQASAEGDLLMMMNSDAIPEPGAISRLLSTIEPDRNIGAVSAVPFTEGRRGITQLLVDLMWTTHNVCSLALNHMNLSNHSCDELVVFRTSAISRLPDDLVNDGAYLAATVRRKGYSVRVCPSARVRIETPRRISDIIRQRRRILFGHAQVWRKVGRPPKTVESLLFSSPLLGLRLLGGTLARHPRFVLALPAALVSELLAWLFSIQDSLRSTKMHTVWRRFS